MANLLKDFNIKKAINSTSPNVLQCYFHEQDLFTGIDFAEQKKKSKEAEYKDFVFLKIQELEDSKAAKIISDFQKSSILSKQNPLTRLVSRINNELIKSDATNLLEELEKAHNGYDKIFLIIKKEPELLDDFYQIFILENQANTYWNRRHQDIITRESDITKNEIIALRIEIKEELKKNYFRKKL